MGAELKRSRNNNNKDLVSRYSDNREDRMTKPLPQGEPASLCSLGPGQLYAQVADRLSDLVLGFDRDGNLFYVSPSVQTVLGYSELVFMRLYNRAMGFSEDRRFAVVQEFVQEQTDKIFGDGIAEDADSELVVLFHRDGFRVALSVQSIALRSDTGELEGVVCICKDVSTRTRNQESTALAARVFENSLTAICIANARGRLIQVNQAFIRMTGYSPEQAVGESPEILAIDELPSELITQMQAGLKGEDFWEGEVILRRKDGTVFPAWIAKSVLRDTRNKVVNTISYFTDVSEKKSKDERIEQLAYFDSLTGLPNRILFTDRMEQAIFRARRRGGSVALLFMDLDQFKRVNDTLGHSVGDQLLQQVGQRITQCVRDEDTVARMGGDEFTVILGGLGDRAQAVRVAAGIAEKIRQVLSLPVEFDGREVVCGTSIGIAFYPSDGQQLGEILQRADEAMYQAKTAGKNNYRFFTETMNANARKRQAMEQGLRQAIQDMQFELHYQPILDVETGDTVAVEALMRWRHPQKGIILPGEFIEIVEQSGVIRPLGVWSINEACKQSLRWKRSGAGINRISLNISPKQFLDGSLVAAIRELHSVGQLEPGALELELREEVLLQDKDYTRETVQVLVELGVYCCCGQFRYTRYVPGAAVNVAAFAHQVRSPVCSVSSFW